MNKQINNVVILHDWLTGYRGGERVLEAICEQYPNAPIYTLIHKPGSTSMFLESRQIRTSFLNYIPGIHKHYRNFLPLMPIAVYLMKIKERNCELMISSSHCVIKGVKKPAGARHICYIHTPMRYIYDQFDAYFPRGSALRVAAKLIRPYLVWWDKSSNKNVDLFVPNSSFVEKRIKKYYGEKIQTHIVKPFVDLQDFEKFKNQAPVKEDFYLMVTAFAPNKRVDLAIKAFNELKLPLKIIGSGSCEEEARLKSLAGSTIEFLGNLSRQEVINYYAKAKAFIFPGVEDFGITPIEANASGTPLIAFRAGGVLETQDDKTATFFDVPEVSSLIEAVKRHENKNHSDLVARANEFSKDKFIRDFKSIL